MVNPVVTLLFDLFLIGSAAFIIASMIAEYRHERAVIARAPGRVVKRAQCAAPGRTHARLAAARQRRVIVPVR